MSVIHPTLKVIQDVLLGLAIECLLNKGHPRARVEPATPEIYLRCHLAPLIMKGKYRRKWKKEVLEKCYLSATTYGCQTWAKSKRLEMKLQVWQRSIERCSLNAKKRWIR